MTYTLDQLITRLPAVATILNDYGNHSARDMVTQAVEQLKLSCDPGTLDAFAKLAREYYNESGEVLWDMAKQVYQSEPSAE